MNWSRWLYWGWYSYLLSKPYGYSKRPTLEMILCRIKGHPNGTVYYNPGGWEPDNHCKDCGEDLG